MFTFGPTGRHRDVSSTSRRLLGAAVIGVASTSALVVPAVSASAAGLGTYSAAVSPASGAVGSTQAYTVTITELSVPNSLDLLHSATATFPTGFSGLSTPSSVKDSNGSSWSVAVSGSTVTLTASGLGLGPLPNQNVSVPVTATAPTTPGTGTIATTATGSLGDAFARSGADPTITTTTAATKLVFVQQPSDTQAGQPITPAVKVAAEDQFNNVVGSFSGPITLATAFNPTTGDSTNPSGLPVTASASSGVASFPSLSIGTAGYGWKLLATTPGLSSATSNAFNVPATVTTCSSTQTCDTGLVGDPGTNQTEVVTSPNSGSTNDVVSVTVSSAVPAPGCAPTGAGFGVPSRFDTTDLSRTVTVTMRLDKSQVNVSANNGASMYTICYQADQAFKTRSGATAQSDGNGNFFGLLPDCAKKNPVAPCVQALGKNGQGDETATLLSLPGDPSTTWH
ncbi:MAG TPA: hypothetical protein VFT62_09505 [Mycobacteriales bacterium]|nr:hypothetical protein [Mycobacteriales bacterium]